MINFVLPQALTMCILHAYDHFSIEVDLDKLFGVLLNDIQLKIKLAYFFQWLFQRDHVQYTIVPVDGKEDLKASFEEYKDQVYFMFFILKSGYHCRLLAQKEMNV